MGVAVVPGARHNTTTRAQVCFTLGWRIMPQFWVWYALDALTLFNSACFAVFCTLSQSAMSPRDQRSWLYRQVCAAHMACEMRAPSSLPQPAWQALQWREAATSCCRIWGLQTGTPRCDSPSGGTNLANKPPARSNSLATAGGYIHSVHCALLPLPRAVGEHVILASH